MVTPEKARELARIFESDTLFCIAIRLRDLANQVERLEAQKKQLREALRVVALVPIEEFGKETKPDYQLMGWNDHRLHVRDVLAARAALKDTE